MSKVIVAPIEVLTDLSLSDSERRVLLALYSFQGGSESVWPSTETLAELVGISDVPRISKITGSLAKKGWLSKRKKGFTGCNSYTLTVPEIKKSEIVAPVSPPQNEAENTNLAESTKLAEDTNTNLANSAKYKEQTIEQTIVKKVKTKKVSKEITFSEWMEIVEASGEPAIPMTDKIFDYPLETGMNPDFLEIAWQAFKNKFTDNSKTYIDWRAVFRRYVKENWGNLWRHDGNQFSLTTQGYQAKQQVEFYSRQAS